MKQASNCKSNEPDETKKEARIMLNGEEIQPESIEFSENVKKMIAVILFG